ncbi:MAG TPA: hypothetical protein VKA83_09325 [Methylomirabilota bacterium]|nr:hypothetical protein [Methylomirabilota bacterium]
MYDKQTLFNLAVDFVSDFFTAFLTSMGVGTAGGTVAAQTLTVPTGWILLLAVCGSLVSALRGLKKNLSQSVPMQVAASKETAAGR